MPKAYEIASKAQAEIENQYFKDPNIVSIGVFEKKGPEGKKDYAIRIGVKSIKQAKYLPREYPFTEFGQIYKVPIYLTRKASIKAQSIPNLYPVWQWQAPKSHNFVVAGLFLGAVAAATVDHFQRNEP